MKEQINIILVDDNPIFLAGLTELLKRETKYNILAVFSSGIELLNFKNLGLANLILLDIEMPEMNGFETAKRVGFVFPYIKIIAITMYQEKVYLQELIYSGFKGFVNKIEVTDNLLNVMKKVLTNNFVFPDELKIV